MRVAGASAAGPSLSATRQRKALNGLALKSKDGGANGHGSVDRPVADDPQAGAIQAACAFGL